MKKPESICVFGDSVSWGAWDTEKGGWVNRLWFYTAKRLGDEYVEVYNCSVSGGTSNTILERLDVEAKVRSADALIFQTGGNDASYQTTPENYLVAPETFKANIEKIIQKAKAITERIVFMDLKNCDEAKTMPVPWIDIYYTNKNIKIYQEIMKDVCAKHDVPVIELAKLDDRDFDDGLHPNAEGHRKIFEQVKDFLVGEGWI